MTNFSGKPLSPKTGNAACGSPQGGGRDSRRNGVAEVSSTYLAEMASPTVPVGFKPTEVGVIPENWEVIKLGDCTSYVGSGKTNTKSRGEYPLYGSTGLIGSCERPEYSGEALLVARVGANAGRLNYVCGEYGVSDNTILVKTKPEHSIDYLKYWLIRKNLNTLVFGSGQPLITGTQLKELALPLPSKTEQAAIANALSDVDALIGEQEKLIAKKQAIKTATMQQLLTGRTRLPQFALREDGTPKGTKPSELGEIPEDWEVVEFGCTLKEFRNGYAFSANGYSSTGTPIITMAQIGLSGSFQFDISKVNKWDSEQQDSLKEFWVRDGDLLIAMTDVTPDKNLIGQMTIAKLGGIALLNQRVGLLRLKNEIAYTGYFSFLSCLPVWKTYCKGVASLGVQANIGTSDIRKAKVPLPSIKEQTAIASILSNMDAEIQALEQRLGKTRQIKQGMMQELLTGKTRLPIT